MKRVSTKRAAQLQHYSIARKAYLVAHPVCVVCQERRSGEIHHQRGREGKLLLDKDFWLAVCWRCHARIHSDPAWAKERGYRK